MKSLYNFINEIPVNQWDYYHGINQSNRIKNPFTKRYSHIDFIRSYFIRAGKLKVFESTGINVRGLRLPNHINSVFYLGILLYNQTSFHNKYALEKNEPGYSSFPFIWFLIALFHDNAYQIEQDNITRIILNLDELRIHFNINYILFNKHYTSNCKLLLDSREQYFKYRISEMGKIDHGLLGGILLYDRLIKIRREAKKYHEEDFFWGKKLEGQYQLAADAISIHNIWLPNSKSSKALYNKYNLDKLISFKPVRFKDFPLFYILGIVDTMEPLKTYQCDADDNYILQNLLLEFKPNSIIFTMNPTSKLDFNKLKQKTKYFKGWLDVEVKKTKNSFELIFK